MNSAHARQRGAGERANAQLKSWWVLRKIRVTTATASSREEWTSTDTILALGG